MGATFAPTNFGVVQDRSPVMRARGLPCWASSVLFAFVLAALLAPLFTPDPRAQDLSKSLQAPFASLEHPLGTDALGRDVLANILHGLRVSLLVGVSATLISAGIGVPLGLLAGSRGGWLEAGLMRLVDAGLSLPSSLVALVVLALWGAGLEKLIVVIGVTGWASFARLARALALSQRHLDYVAGATALGMSGSRVVWRHVLPNVAGSLIVKATLEVPGNILLEATLSFLGLGAGVDTPSLGQMIATGYGRLSSGEWWLSLLPGVVLTGLVLSISALGDGLRDRLDPRSR
jgi:peptide/nickel transport system permease protein